MIGVAVVLGMLSWHDLASAYEAQGASTGGPYFQKPSNALLDTPFFLNFSQRYYQMVEISLQNKSYFAFRYYLASPFESFDKQEFISENPTQASELAQGALHNTIRKAVEDIELLEILRDYLYAMTSLQIRMGVNGTQFQGPSLTGDDFPDSIAKTGPDHAMAINSGLTFADDLRLGLKLAVGYHQITSKLSYYPASGNEIGCTAETQLTASSKIGLSYHLSQNDNAVATTFSFLF